MKKFIKTLKPFLKWFISTCVIAAAVIWYLHSAKEKEEPAAEFKTQTEADIQPVPVKTALADTGDIVMRISATGVTKALQEIILCPVLGGNIVRIEKSEGEFVKEGGLILKIDDRSFRLALEEAENKVLEAQVNFGLLLQDDSEKIKLLKSEWNSGNEQKSLNEAKRLFKQGKISEHTLEEAEIRTQCALIFSGEKRKAVMANQSGLTSALIAKKRAELDLSYTDLRAPFSGILGNQKVFQGQHISAGQECYTLVDLSQIRVEIEVLESEIGKIRKGNYAEVHFTTFPGEVFKGKITAVNPLVNPETKTCRVTAILDNPGLKIKAGMFAFVKLEARIYHNRFRVPREAVLVRDERKLVFVVRDKHAKWCYVKTGLENDEYYEILSSAQNLKAGEPVIVSGHYTLIHDAPVKIINEQTK
ncbi:efflux RND transporter periplasmic adaptor subunit [bacterium]|nr:efflux RND transporter periplasmic adaptor subunit [bacterium]